MILQSNLIILIKSKLILNTKYCLSKITWYTEFIVSFHTGVSVMLLSAPLLSLSPSSGNELYQQKYFIIIQLQVFKHKAWGIHVAY